MGHINIPVFIPHMGCPNQCIFCNQRHISGTVEFSEDDVEKQILKIIEAVDEKDIEIAFFGGSFTGIDRNLMIRLLDLAQKYVNLGKAKSIRMSTRPDYISEEILDILDRYSISCVELGIQSMNDDVLRFLKRGHSTNDTINAIKLLNKRNIPFVGQMMIGLPKATIQDEIYCAEFICKNGAVGSRIYPTLVFNQTELADLTKSGEYTPLSLDEAVYRSSEVLNVFVENNVPCIRIGLCESENLHSDKTFVAGPNHPSIGEMVKSQLYRKLIIERFSKVTPSKDIIIECPCGAVSQIVGNKKKNLIEFRNTYGIKRVKIRENPSLKPYDIKIITKED